MYARWSYRRQFRSLLLCLMSVKGCYFPLLIQILTLFENLLRSHHTTLVACVHEFYVGADYDHVPLVEFMYPVVACMPGGVTAGSSGLCCCLFSIEHNYFPLLIQIFTLKFSLVYTTQLLSPVCRSSTLAQTMTQKIRSDSKHSPLNRSVCFTSVAACH